MPPAEEEKERIKVERKDEGNKKGEVKTRERK